MNLTEQQRSSRDIICAMCSRILAVYHPQSDRYTPSPEELYQQGRVPVPNFGWFCGQLCANQYEQTHNIHFQRNSKGEVSYY